MKQSVSSTTEPQDIPARERLRLYLERSGCAVDASRIIALTPDASVRAYFRIPWHGATAVAAVYPEPFDPATHPFLDVTQLFAEAGLPVPQVIAVEGELGIIVQEDLGDRQLRNLLETASEDEREQRLEEAIGLIAQIQAATELAYARDSICSRLAFDEAKLSWELDFFYQHYFGSLRGEKLSDSEERRLKDELYELARELAARPRILCHRDFHVSNLMVDQRGRLRIIDHQDARMGPASYDLVSLLLDRQKAPPSLAELRERRLFFLEARASRGLPTIDPDEFAREFRLTTVQRGLKAVGTFSCQTAVYGRGRAYARFIRPTLEIVLQALEWLGRFPEIRRQIAARIKDPIELEVS
ncbi:aminoglycoside phosphotransferase family protein [Pyrinomonas methylaliphatogenes]|jgi:aminoglycoside/choline kinase family phosphotransferase|uniref:Aminoglycoside phosphotransferase n=1 Tax=Pyrinomonas methylaliphatogenes TaxID=454194 RepID=A0A0B6WYF6_9BACT|nr:phosphotransferase [Pyrinomonas methylaliphatogenes]MBX5480038.1 phosphotransferase [Pyrinomonas methylaliphatogenes]CDM65339.1 aminoglycoside phosphotransferase [Pyrinomonas methylaliphatogenes]